jgi:hypothetical protein
METVVMSHFGRKAAIAAVAFATVGSTVFGGAALAYGGGGGDGGDRGTVVSSCSTVSNSGSPGSILSATAGTGATPATVVQNCTPAAVVY